VAITSRKGRADDELERLLTRIDATGAGATLPTAAREAVRARTRTLFEACERTPTAVGSIALAYASELLGATAVDLAADREAAQRVIAGLEDGAGLARVALGREVLRAGTLLELPVEVAIEAQLALLMVFAGLRSVSLWKRPGPGRASAVSHAGESPGAAARGAAEVLLQDRDAEAPAGIVGVRIERLLPPPAAVLAVPAGAASPSPGLLMASAVPMLAALLDREALLLHQQTSEEEVMSAVQRRLARLRFDLHDGPQQDVHLLAQDLALFREQLRPMIAGDPNADRAIGRLDDLEAQLVALDGDLRRLSSSVQSPFLAPGSLPQALTELTDAFAARTGVEPVTRLSGALDHLTDSQQITLLALIREALSNIRKHSDAGAVQITIDSDELGVRAEITDDGRGFDTETTLVRAARAGRLGLVGMHERVRMLGGRTEISSRPGGPTVISATLPRWPSVAP
jgi:signal transduction histidine kinase